MYEIFDWFEGTLEETFQDGDVPSELLRELAELRDAACGVISPKTALCRIKNPPLAITITKEQFESGEWE